MILSRGFGGWKINYFTGSEQIIHGSQDLQFNHKNPVRKFSTCYLYVIAPHYHKHIKYSFPHLIFFLIIYSLALAIKYLFLWKIFNCWSSFHIESLKSRRLTAKRRRMEKYQLFHIIYNKNVHSQLQMHAPIVEAAIFNQRFEKILLWIQFKWERSQNFVLFFVNFSIKKKVDVDNKE